MQAQYWYSIGLICIQVILSGHALVQGQVNRNDSVNQNQAKIIKYGLICNYSGILGLESSAGAITIAMEKLKADGYLKDYEFQYDFHIIFNFL